MYRLRVSVTVHYVDFRASWTPRFYFRPSTKSLPMIMAKVVIYWSWWRQGMGTVIVSQVFFRGTHQCISLTKGQQCEAFIFSLVSAWHSYGINGGVAVNLRWFNAHVTWPHQTHRSTLCHKSLRTPSLQNYLLELVTWKSDFWANEILATSTYCVTSGDKTFYQWLEAQNYKSLCPKNTL